MDSGGPKSLPLGSLTLCDINVLVYAHRKDGHPDHAQFSAWLKRSVEGPQPFGLSEAVLAGFVRIVTNPAIFKDPTPIGKALDFCQNLRLQAGAVFVQPDHAHWKIFLDWWASICRQGNRALLLVRLNCLTVSKSRLRRWACLPSEKPCTSPGKGVAQRVRSCACKAV